MSKPIRRVWIQEGCISCSLCQEICPEVFDVQDGEDCVVRPDAPKHFQGKDEEIRDAACDCPVEVIQYGDGEDGEDGGDAAPPEGS